MDTAFIFPDFMLPHFSLLFLDLVFKNQEVIRAVVGERRVLCESPVRSRWRQGSRRQPSVVRASVSRGFAIAKGRCTNSLRRTHVEDLSYIRSEAGDRGMSIKSIQRCMY